MSACKACEDEAFGTYFCDAHLGEWSTSPEFRALNVTSTEAEYVAQVDSFAERVKGAAS